MTLLPEVSTQFETIFQSLVYTRTYARWIQKQQRREYWPEGVARYIGFLREEIVLKRGLPEEALNYVLGLLKEAEEEMLALGVVGSMRALWTAGKALKIENACAYNCAYTTIEHYKDFAEILYLLMCGCGVSYSAERQFICKLRPIPMLKKSDKVVIFRDSKKGWAKGYYEFISHLIKGNIPKYDLSKIRKKGMILKTFGGRSSGPEPLRDLLIFTTRLFDRSQGGKLTSEDVSDLVCKIADIVVVGGARRSATLALTNPSDRRMAEYKKGDYFKDHKYRSMVNVSSCYTDAKKPGVLPFLEDFTHLIESKSGERGFVNRVALNKSMETLGRPHSEGVGVNPCGEIILRPKGFCNLSEIIVRDGDTLDILRRKAKLATVLGFLQSLLNDFNFISSKWKQNCIEDRILGLSLTGLRDHAVLGVTGYKAEGWLKEMYKEAHAQEYTLAKLFGVEPAKAITCVKPSGTVSQLVNSASGLHVRYAKQYIRRMRIAANDPLSKLLIAQSMDFSPENGETYENARTYVFSFPIDAPHSSVVKADVTAVQQLDYWKMLKTSWCDHNPSCTVYVRDHEWVDVAAWVYANFDILGGISFLPDDNNYDQAPYEEITHEEYILALAGFPIIDLTKLSDFEKEDYTTGAQEAACSGGNCELN